MSRRVVVIGGPTASGKSALAMAVARRLDGLVVNADSMQCHRDLPILTARPSAADEAAVPHRLYGWLAAGEQGTAGRWLERLRTLLQQDERSLVIVGGTGLYLDALLNGIAAIPPIRPDIRAEVRRLGARLPPAELHALLATEDAGAAETVRPSDPQRLMRALEVIRSTGRSLRAWQAAPVTRLDLPSPPVGIALLPPRAALVERIERRLELMLAAGALDELRDFLVEPGHAGSPLLKAVGVPELRAHLVERVPLPEAAMAAVIATRRYAKRQSTFLRHRLPMLQPLAAFGDDPRTGEAVLARLGPDG